MTEAAPEVRRSRKIKMKDPNKPKRYASGYFLFLGANREKFTQELTAQGHSGKQLMFEVSRLAGKRWKLCADTDKKQFIDESAILKAEYDEKMAIYKETDGAKAFQKMVARKRRAHKMALARPDNCPKRAPGAYFLWLNENRDALTKECRDKDLQGRMAPHVTRLAGQRWGALPETEKTAVRERAATLRAEYDEKMKIYKESAEYKKYQKKFHQVKRALKSGKPTKLAKPDNHPKRAMSSYFLWMNENREALTKECEGKEGNIVSLVGKLAGQKWGQLSDEQRSLSTRNPSSSKPNMRRK